MRKIQSPKKEKVSYISLLQIQVTRDLEEELLRTVLPYKEKPLSQQPEGRVFCEALQKHIWDDTFPHILKSPRIRLLPVLKEQWLAARDFCVVVLWIWKSENGMLFDQASRWLAINQPDAGKVYTEKPDEGETVDAVFSAWAEQYAQETPDTSLAAIKLAMALTVYQTSHPGLFDLQPRLDTEATRVEKKTAHTAGKNRENPMTSSNDKIWKTFLEKLHAIPPEDFPFDGFEEFVGELRQIVSEKDDQRTALNWTRQLAEEISQTVLALGPWESYFNFTGHQTWSVESLSSQSWDEIPARLQQLRGLLSKLGQLREIQPASKEERRTHERNVNSVEDEISSQYAQLARSFVGSSESPDRSMHEMRDQDLEVSTQAVDIPIEEGDASSSPMVDDARTVVQAGSAVVNEPEQISEDVLENPDDATAFVENASPEVLNGEYGTVETEQDSQSRVAVSSEIIDQELNGELEEALSERTISAEMVEVSDSVEESDEPERAATETDLSPSIETTDYGVVTLDEANRVLLEDVSKGNLLHAYWVAQALEHQGWDSALPSWLIAGIQGAHWAQSYWPDHSQSLFAGVSEVVQFKDKSVSSQYAYFTLSIAIGLSLLERSESWTGWLEVENLPTTRHLNHLIEKIYEFSLSGGYLDPPILQNILGKEEAETRIKELSGRAGEWLTQAPFRRTRFSGSDQVWQLIVGQKGVLHEWYDAVGQDQRALVHQTEKQVGYWKDRSWVIRQLQKLFQGLHGASKTIDGEARDQMIRWISEAADLAQQWCDAVSKTQPSTEENHWLKDKTALLCDDFKQTLPPAIDEVRDLLAMASSPLEKSQYVLLENTLRLLARQLGLPDQDTLELVHSAFQAQKSFQENLASILVNYPEIELKDNGIPANRFSLEDASVLVRARHNALDAAAAWLERHDYRFIDTLVGSMSVKDRDRIGREKEERLYSDIQILEQEVDRTVERVEQSLADGLFAEDEYIEDVSRVESVRKQLKIINVSEPALSSPNLRKLSSDLKMIRSKLDARHAGRLDSSRNHWKVLSAGLSKYVLDENLRSQVISSVEQDFERQNLRAVTEAMSHLEDVAAGNKKLSVELFTNVDTVYKVKEFTQEIREMIPDLDKTPLLRKGEQFTRRLPSDRVHEVQEALGAWQKLKKEESKNQKDINFSYLITVMKYLGWETDESSSPVSIASQAPMNFQHWRIYAAPRVPVPVYQFGSERMKEFGSIGRYDVVGAWGRPGFEAIDALMERLGKIPCILLYFGRMQPTQRAELMRLAKRKQLPLLVIDELLMLFLAKEYEVRLSAMFECTLPYASINPYVPFAAGGVPPEMYFGRNEESKALLDPYGPSIVYGGRQLGKSALLKRAQREFHKPQQGQFAIYEDIRLIGAPTTEQDYRKEILDRLLTAFVRENVLEKSRQQFDMEKMSDQLISQIRSNGWRVLLLIDEADNLLEADAQRNFYVVTHLKRVMDQTDRMFKVVFAGLHHVQQFRNISNQPLSHLGDVNAIEIGPLEANAAIELIKEPLRNVGYIFGKPGQEDSSLVAHILSYTNYHPGLLQIFGQYLVEHLNTKQQIGTPPFSITRADIEAVYRNPKLRETIRDRFKITLALDERYEAVTLALILDQWHEKNGFDRLFTPEELFGIAQIHWPEGFSEDVYPDKFKVFLEEMRGLGVLSASGIENRKYRLRSPNLVPLMGTEDQIYNRLQTISENRPANKQRILECYHAPINPPYYSPLTYSQEREIAGNTSGVCLVFGSEATRVYGLSDALKATAQKMGAWTEIRVAARSEDALSDQLKIFLKQNSRENFLMAFRELDGSPDEMAEQVLAAARFCRKNRERKLRIVFQLDALSAYHWLQLPLEMREDVEQNHVDNAVTLNRWDKLGIRQLLEQHEPELLASESNIRKIYEVTGGWPYLLDAVIDLCKDDTDPLPALSRLKKNLVEKTERSRFIQALGISDPKLIGFLRRILTQDETTLRSFTYQEMLDLLFEDIPAMEAQTVYGYLKRLSILQAGRYLVVEPIVAKIINELEL